MLAYRSKQAFEYVNGSTDSTKDPPPGTSHLLFLTDQMSESEKKKNHTLGGGLRSQSKRYREISPEIESR